MSGEKVEQESIGSRIASGERVCFQFWTRSDEVGIWLVLAMFLGTDSLFLFFEGGSVTLFLVVLPICFLPFGLFMFERRDKISRELILDESGAHLKYKGSYMKSIAWSDLEGLYKTKKGAVILAHSGSRILIPRTLGGIKMRQLQDSIIDYLTDRSRWIDEKRELQPVPLPARTLKRRLYFCAPVALVTTLSLQASEGFVRYPDLYNGELLSLTLVLTGLAIVCAISVIALFRTLNQLAVQKRPYLWDITVPTPPREPPDIEQHRKINKKRPARIEMERGKTYVYRKYSVSSGQIRLSLFGGALFVMLLLAAPVVAYLDDSQPDPSSAGMVVITLFTWTIAAFLIIYIVWAVMWLKPYLSKYRLEGDELSVEYKGVARQYAASTVRDGKLWFFPSYFGGNFEVFGDDKEQFRLDRRYLREINDGEYFDLR